MIQSIVLAEDSLEHCFSFRKALKAINPSIHFIEVYDGDKLMELLENYLPDLLFIDLAMPCKSGIQCIGEIRENREYEAMPIIVFTISSQHNAIQAAYGLGANLYIIKPHEYSELVYCIEKVLTMNWRNPKAITQQYFHDNNYLPFH